MQGNNINGLINRILENGKITRAEQAELNALILLDGKVSPEEKEQMERLWKLITDGEIRVVP